MLEERTKSRGGAVSKRPEAESATNYEGISKMHENIRNQGGKPLARCPKMHQISYITQPVSLLAMLPHLLHPFNCEAVAGRLVPSARGLRDGNVLSSII